MVAIGCGGLRCDLRVEGDNSRKRNRTSSRGESALRHGMAAMGWNIFSTKSLVVSSNIGVSAYLKHLPMRSIPLGQG